MAKKTGKKTTKKQPVEKRRVGRPRKMEVTAEEELKEYKAAEKRFEVQRREKKEESVIKIDDKEYTVMDVANVSVGLAEIVGNTTLYVGFGMLFDYAGTLVGAESYILTIIAIFGLVYFSVALISSIFRAWRAVRGQNIEARLIEI
ncbi:MAG: hypothetical protein PHY47_00615 [Lachnospiraceae bacterium]|nr:hypothetical protein [Lachnospiraceae bacterium]